jgi:putative ABC transport system substrate-binding protein
MALPSWAHLCTQAGPRNLPAIYPFLEYALAGGLMSYGSSQGYYYHQASIYNGRVLKGRSRPKRRTLVKQIALTEATQKTATHRSPFPHWGKI